jgi:hypothetical protein
MPIVETVNGRNYRVGDIITIKDGANKTIHCTPNLKCIIYCRNKNDKNLIGLQAMQEQSHWHDLDGHLDPGYGYWVNSDTFRRIVSQGPEKVKVVKSFKIGEIDLKGKTGKVVGFIEDKKYPSTFVEFEENVGGCSADGLGKRGHCVAIPKSALSNTE